MEDPTLPTYTETDDNSLETWLAELESAQLDGPVTFPMTQHPTYTYIYQPQSDNSPLSSMDIYKLQSRIIASFHISITKLNTEAVTLLLSRGLLSPEIPSFTGKTPLITAVEAGSGSMVCTLIGLGADPHAYGTWGTPPRQRTPLHVAAATGNLALVKLLVEDFGADDAEIAPDGQLALRLAAEAGHREIVEYLPLRRGGAWRRWKTHHEIAVGRARAATANMGYFFKFVLWELPHFLLWTVPKESLVRPMKRHLVWAWRNRDRFGGWCKRTAKVVAQKAKELPQRLAMAAKKMGRDLVAGIKRIPARLVRLRKQIRRFLAAIPKALRIAAVWVWGILSKTGQALANAALRVVAVLHTAVTAVLTFFRDVTLKDILDGIWHALEAIFVLLPEAIWSGIKSFGEVSYKVMTALFGTLGELVWWLIRVLIWVAVYVPTQLGKVIAALGSSVTTGVYEIPVWFDPKR